MDVDYFEVLGGPEDGTIYPITRTPIDVGRDPNCAIHLRFDKYLDSSHARVTSVSEGYRVRALGPGNVLVDGKRAGFIHSRIVRHGGIIRAGDSELILLTSPDGLAGRSSGLPLESDFAWAMRVGIRRGAQSVRGALRLIIAATRNFGCLLTLGILAGLVFFFQPWVWSWVRYLAYRAYFELQQLVGRGTDLVQ